MKTKIKELSTQPLPVSEKTRKVKSFKKEPIIETIPFELLSPKDQLLTAPVPAATSTYAPVAHAEILNTLYEQLDKSNYKVIREDFTINKRGNQVIGRIGVASQDDDLGMMIAFRNSYDMSMSVGFAAGSEVWICGNGMVSGDIKLIRKHTGSVVAELKAKVLESVDYLETELVKHIQFRETSKCIEVNKRDMAELAGRLFIEQEILNSQQMSVIKNQILFSENFKDDTAWSIYNHATEALKSSHSYEYLNKHINLHEFFLDEFKVLNAKGYKKYMHN